MAPKRRTPFVAHRLRAATITIRFDRSCADVSSLLNYVQQLWGTNCACVYVGKQYCINYCIPIVFTVTGATVAQNNTVPVPQHTGFIVYNGTQIKVEDEVEENQEEPLLVGYEEELSKLNEAVRQLFSFTRQPDMADTQNSNTFNPPKTIINQNVTSDSTLLSSTVCQDLTTSFNPDLTFPSSPLTLISSLPSSSFNEDSTLDLTSCMEGLSISSKLPHSETPKSPLLGGILVVIPPQCGKTLLLRRLSQKYNSITYRKEPKPSGSNKDISVMFGRAAQCRPCLILIDDLDSIEDSKALCSCLDRRTEGVLVVGTTSTVERVPAQLRSPGRLSTTLTVPSPDAGVRCKMFEAMLRGTGVQLSAAAVGELGSLTHGFSGQDCSELCLELLLADHDQEISVEVIREATTRRRATLQASGPISSQLRDVQESSPKLLTVCGYKEQIEFLNTNISLSLHQAHLYSNMGLSPPSRVLLFGPPGCGKTHLIKALAQRHSLALKTVTRTNIFGKYFGESENNLNDIFDKAMSSVPCILHFPSFEGVASVRGESHHEVEGRVVNLLKARLDGTQRLKGLFVFAETSRPDLLDKAIIRRGRFMDYVHINLPSDRDRHDHVEYLLPNLSPIEQLSIVQSTDGCTVAEVSEVCRRAKSRPLVEVLQSVPRGVKPSALKRLQTFSQIYAPEGNMDPDIKST